MSSWNKFAVDKVAQQHPSQESVLRMVFRNADHHCLVSNVGSKYGVTILSQGNYAAGRKKALVNRECTGSNTRAESILPTLKLIAINLEIEKLWLTLASEKVAIKAAASTMEALRRR